MLVARRDASGLTWWECEYCGYRAVTEAMVIMKCALCVNRVIDCGDFALRVRDERWFVRKLQ